MERFAVLLCARSEQFAALRTILVYAISHFPCQKSMALVGGPAAMLCNSTQALSRPLQAATAYLAFSSCSSLHCAADRPLDVVSCGLVAAGAS